MRLPLLALAAAVGVAALIVAPPPAQAAAHDFHIDCGAGANGTGSAGSPWNGVAAANGHGAFAPGDRILLKRGTTCHGRLAPAGDGTAKRPIVIGAYGSGAKPTVAGGGTGTWEGAVQLTDQQWWTVQDLRVTNTDGAAVTSFYRSGVMLLNRGGAQLHGVVVRRLAVDHVTSSLSDAGNGSRSFGGISAITMPGLRGGFTDLRIEGNRVERVGRTGIITTNISWGDGGDVRPRITGNRVDHPRGDGIVMLGATAGRIDHNVSAYANDLWPCPDCGGISPRTANAGIWTGSSRGVRIDHNEAYGTKRLGGDGEGFDIDIAAVDTVLEANYSHDNEGGGVLICGSGDATVRFNIFEDNDLGAFTFIGSIPADGTRIHNNTVYIGRGVPDGQVVRTFGGTGGSGTRFFNNLVYARGGSSQYHWPHAVDTRANTFVGTHGGSEPGGAGTSRRDPGLRAAGSGARGFGTLGGYRPQSPRNDPAGIAIPASVRTDFFGARIDPAAPPRGAAG